MNKAEHDIILNLFFENKKRFMKNLFLWKETFLNAYFECFIELLTKDDEEENSEKHIIKQRKEFSVSDLKLFDNIYCATVTVPLCFLNKITNSKYYIFLYRKNFWGISNAIVVTIDDILGEGSYYSVYYSKEIYGKSPMYLTPAGSLLGYLYCNGCDFVRRHEITDIKIFSEKIMTCKNNKNDKTDWHFELKIDNCDN